MAFNIDNLFIFCQRSIKEFSLNHQNEKFYGFSIDANLLCFNSVEAFEKTITSYSNKWMADSRLITCMSELTDKEIKSTERLLALHEKYNGLNRQDIMACLSIINTERMSLRDKGNPYLDEDVISEMRNNTGDWFYQGFSELLEEDGFDFDAYHAHYEMNEIEQITSSYAIAMNNLLELLKGSNAFDSLRKTEDFYIRRVEHNY